MADATVFVLDTENADHRAVRVGRITTRITTRFATLHAALLASVWCSTGCGSAYESCRFSAGMEQNQVSRELALDRCEAVANREYSENVRQDQLKRQHEAEQSEGAARLRAESRRWQAARAESLRKVRHAPDAPGLGYTPSESDALCRQQGGVTSSSHGPESAPGTYQVCEVGGATIYVAHLGPDEAGFSAVKVLYEGRSLEATQSTFESEFGPADDVEVENGYRVWHWNRPSEQVYLRGYAMGVSVTTRKPRAVEPRAIASNLTAASRWFEAGSCCSSQQRAAAL